jgi:hypothetical protein
LTNCLICSTIREGIPFADLAIFTVTNCGTSCGGSPTPTPTPSSTGTGDFVYYILIDCQTFETKYSQRFTNGTFNSGDRVMGSYGYYYVVSGTIVSAPGLETFVTATGYAGCP